METDAEVGVGMEPNEPIKMPEPQVPQMPAPSGGMLGARPQGSNGLFYAPNRDIGHLAPMLFREAASTTYVMLCRFHELDPQEIPEDAPVEFKAGVRALDTLTKYFVDIHGACREERLEGILRYNEILETCERDPVFKEVYFMHAAVLQQLVFCCLFTTKQFPIGSSPLTDDVLIRSTQITQLLSAMDKEQRQAALDNLQKNGEVPKNFDTDGLRRHIEQIGERIRAQQDAEIQAALEKRTKQAVKKARQNKRKQSNKRSRASRRKNR